MTRKEELENDRRVREQRAAQAQSRECKVHRAEGQSRRRSQCGKQEVTRQEELEHHRRVRELQMRPGSKLKQLQCLWNSVRVFGTGSQRLVKRSLLYVWLYNQLAQID